MVKNMSGTFYVHNDGDLNLEWDGNNSFEMSDDVRQVYHDLGLDEFLD